MEMEAQTTSLRVLVVDNDHDCADSLADLLRIWGHDAYVVYSAHTAIATAPAYDPHVVLAEIILPGMDGCELARRLRTDERFRPTLLVAITGYLTEASRTRALRSGFDLHFAKPVDLDMLDAVLRHARAMYAARPDSHATPPLCQYH